MTNFILSIDQGTTGTTALLIDINTMKIVDKCNQEYPQHYPKPSWVEHDLNDIWGTVKKTTSELLNRNKINPSQVKSIGITNQRETTCAYDRHGNPLAKAIVWQDRRTSDFCTKHKANYEKLQLKTGLPLDPYFSATKMRWLLENNPLVSSAAKSKNLHLSTIDTFLLYKLSGCKSYATDPSNASRTLLVNLSTGDWDNELLSFFGIERDFLPEIYSSFGEFGKTQGLDFLPDGIPVFAILGDQQSALFGQGCFHSGEMKITYGTGAFLLQNTGNNIVYSKNGLLTTIAYKNRNEIAYAVEGATYIAGAAVQWLRDNLNLFPKSSEIEILASQISDYERVRELLFLPFFTGIASPYWEPNARAAILGMTRDTSKSDLSYACLEGIALSINDLVATVKLDNKNPISNIKVDGGMCANNLFLQLQADLLGVDIIRPSVIETTAYGVALGALVGSGDYSLNDLKSLWKEDRRFNANPTHNEYFNYKKSLWSKSIKSLYLK